MNNERTAIGKIALIAFVLFEAGMLLWFMAISNGSYDPVGPPAALSLRNPVGSLWQQMAQIEARRNFMVGFYAVWVVGSLILGLLSWVTRPRGVFISEDR